MALSVRTLISLIQFLELQADETNRFLLYKYGLSLDTNGSRRQNLVDALSDPNAPSTRLVLEEVLSTAGDLRTRVSPRYTFDLRMADLQKCLTLDGYRCRPFPHYNPTSYTLVPIEPDIEGVASAEDDLTSALSRSGLSKAEDIKSRLADSAAAFRLQPPDFNACLTNARVALEELAIEIAGAVGTPPATGFSWGTALVAIRQAGYITLDHEKGLAGVYTFISHGAHKHMSLTDEEMARLGRSLAISMCYFLVRVYAG